MSDNIPFEIQLEIIKKLPDVKSLIRFRSVSKPWKSFIDSSEFITSYGSRPTNRLLLSYKEAVDPYEVKYVYFVDDVNDTLTLQQDFAPALTDFMKQFNDLKVIGSSHGLLCFYTCSKGMFVLWNPSLKKSVRIVSTHKFEFCPVISDDVGFMVCPVTSDPTIVDFSHRGKLRIFTLSSKRWNLFPCSNLPRESVSLCSTQVVIDRCIYWVAYEFNRNIFSLNYMILSFDLIAKEFRVVAISRNVCRTSNPHCASVSISKLRESLVLFETKVCAVWKMEHDGSFTKLFTINTPGSTIYNILRFRKNSEPVIETKTEFKHVTVLEVYQPCSKHISGLGISGISNSFFMDSYKETLLLLNHSDGCVYPDLSSFWR